MAEQSLQDNTIFYSNSLVQIDNIPTMLTVHVNAPRENKTINNCWVPESVAERYGRLDL